MPKYDGKIWHQCGCTWTNIYTGTAISAFPINTVFSTPSHIGPRLLYSDQQLLVQELKHIRTALSRSNNPDWVFHRLQTKLDYQLSLQYHNINPNAQKDINKTKDIYIVVPYSRGLNESFKNVCGKAGVQVYFKGNYTIKDLLVPPPRTSTTSLKKEVLSTDISVTIWDAQWSTSVRLIGPLGIDTRNILGPPVPFMAMPTPGVIPSNWTVSL